MRLDCGGSAVSKEGVGDSMRAHRWKRSIWLAVVLGSSVLSGGSTRGDQITSIVNFGDSLSDVGNDYLASNGAVPSSSDYYQGRFSNGLNWADYLAKDLGVAAPTASLAGGNDFAFGGAQTGTGYTSFSGAQIPNTGTQISMYLAGHTPTANQLFTIWGGANDFLNGGQTNPLVPVQNIAQEITTLANAGAKDFLVPNLPLLGQIPAASQLTAAQQQSLNLLSVSFNSALQYEVGQLQNSLGVKIDLVNIQQLFQNVMANPSQYGFTNVTGSAINSSLAGNGYLFWDTVHPTTTADAFVGDLAAQSVPEPSSLLVFGALGALAVWRTRQRRNWVASSIE